MHFPRHKSPTTQQSVNQILNLHESSSKPTIDNLVQLGRATNDAQLYARFVAKTHHVRNLVTEEDHIAHSAYFTDIQDLALNLTFKAVLEYDIRFRSALFDGQVQSRADHPDQLLYMMQSFCRIRKLDSW
eukprot:SAG11_NODE_7626_length_1119_cov_2.071569_1_plen_130_part_00